eukprot:314667-Prymnesium_polylepis.1
MLDGVAVDLPHEDVRRPRATGDAGSEEVWPSEDSRMLDGVAVDLPRDDVRRPRATGDSGSEE